MSTYPTEFEQAIKTASAAATKHVEIDQAYKESLVALDQAEDSLRKTLKKHRAAILAKMWPQLWDVNAWTHTATSRQSLYKHEVADARIAVTVTQSNIHVLIEMVYGQGRARSIKLYESWANYSDGRQGRKEIPWSAYKTAQLWALKEGVGPHVIDDEEELEAMGARIDALRTHLRENGKKLSQKDRNEYQQEVYRLRARKSSQEGVFTALRRQQELKRMREEIIAEGCAEIDALGLTADAPVNVNHTIYLSGGYQVNLRLNSWLYVKAYTGDEKPIINSSINASKTLYYPKVSDAYKELVEEVCRRFNA